MSRVLAFCLVLGAVRPLIAQDPLVMRIGQVAPGAYLISGFANGNLLALVGEREVMLVDGQSAKRVTLADSALRTVTSLPVTLVISTHYHSDHIEGNPYWRARGASVAGHAAIARAAVKDTTIAELDWHRVPAVPEALPDRLFDDSLVLDQGGERVVLIHPGPSHTGGDAIVWLPGRNVVHTGDILEREAEPFIDWWDGGSLDGMIAGVDRVLGIANRRTIIVPGHGTPTDRDGLLAYRAMLVAARDRISAGIARGETPETVADGRPLREFEAGMGGERRARRFVLLTAAGLRR